MATVGRDLQNVELTERELWLEGPPHEVFKQMRHQCPIHWTESFEEFPEEAGFWSVTTAEDIHTVSRDFGTYSSERGGVLAAAAGFPLELAQAMFIGMDPPKHDRLKALFQSGFTPKRIADHEGAIREIVRRTLDRLDGRESCDLVLLEALTVDLGVHEDAREVVGRGVLSLGDQLATAFEDLGNVFLDHALDALRREVLVAGSER